MGSRVALVFLFTVAALCAQESARPPEKKKPDKAAIPPDWPPKHDNNKFEVNLRQMVRTQIHARGVRDEGVLAAMRVVPRRLFMPANVRRFAWQDRPVPIGQDQTISQPYIIASMTEELHLERGMKVLEIGTGSGYQAAVLAQITPLVYTIEIKRVLAHRAKNTLKKLGYKTVKTREGDGYYGWKQAAPFDAIIVTAAAPHVPPPLVEQLKRGGRMILPVGPPFRVQDLRLVTKDDNGRVRTKSLYAVRFVPLTGSLGKEEKASEEPKPK